MAFVLANVPVIPLRAEPAHRSEMTSQLVFGEAARLIEQRSDGWIRIHSVYDGYEAWAQESQFGSGQEPFPGGKELSATFVSQLEWNGAPMHIPLGSIIDGIQESETAWQGHQAAYGGKRWKPAEAQRSMNNLQEIATLYLNVPYLWGGKTVFGTDCSGYTQTVYRFLGIPLLRDAWQQAGQGNAVAALEFARPGDLAFFDNEAGRITHVGIMLGEGQIIHASGKVRIDRIDETGIIQAESGKKTHHLKLIRRFGIHS